MIAALDDLLRAEGVFRVGRGRVPLARLTLWLVVCGFGYGLAMGSFPGRVEQALYSGSKVPLLLTVSTLICLPNFFVVNAMLGLRDDFSAALRAVVTAQATVAVTLLALGPVILFFYASTGDYRSALLVNGVHFAIATLAGQRTLARHYAPLERSNPNHRHARRGWVVLYVFVAIQCAWVLRPFVGTPGMGTTFFREEAFTNGYVRVWRALVGA